jgi:diguanylate cyclase (GGDEF)-like protein
MWHALREIGQWRGEIWNRRKDGTVYPGLLTIAAVVDEGGQATGYVGVFSDIRPLKQSEERLHHLAHHDPLTDLPNRLLFTDRLDQSIRHAQRQQVMLAVLFIDLDRFKHINDSLGHSVGDRLLQQFAQRLSQTLRAEGTVARISGDEFVVLPQGVHGSAAVTPVACKLIETLKQPFLFEHNEIRVAASIGISLFPNDGHNAALLLRNADAAMYRAKDDGVEKLEALRAKGIGIAIDDFGTGYSSLSRLKRLAVDKLELDQTFVRDIPRDRDDMAIRDAVISIARALGLAIIAEGVETEA